MKFEGRELNPYIETVAPDDLVDGHVYFSVSYADEQMLLPTILSLVFVGKNLEPGDDGEYYFQDLDSYTAGVRYGDTSEEIPASFHTGDIVNSIQHYDQALNELLRCSIRRNDPKNQSHAALA
jgi:hypothetical protein